MEQLNQVIIRGIVGNARIQTIGNTEMVRFSVATTYSQNDKAGNVVYETTWHAVTAFKNDRMPDFATIVRGAGVEVKGRLRNQRYVDSDGNDRTTTDILANEVAVIGK